MRRLAIIGLVVTATIAIGRTVQIDVPEAVGAGLLDLIVLGRIPGTEVQLNFFALIMTILVCVMLLSLWYRAFISQLTIFRLRKNRELRQAVVVEPESSVSKANEVVAEVIADANARSGHA